MSIIDQDLYQFSTYLAPINLTFHQYLLAAPEPLLIHTGNVQQAMELVPQLKERLEGRVLNYIFISHFEADECGGLSLVMEAFPEAKPICSEVTARQLRGFGYIGDVIVKKPGEKLTSTGYELEFFSYPSEMHLWEGLLLFENKRGIFFSSDLMIRFGEAAGQVVSANWQDEINNIRPEQLPDPDLRAKLQQTLRDIRPRLVATGHGPCLNLI